jgi:hypothetical protein
MKREAGFSGPADQSASDVRRKQGGEGPSRLVWGRSPIGKGGVPERIASRAGVTLSQRQREETHRNNPKQRAADEEAGGEALDKMQVRVLPSPLGLNTPRTAPKAVRGGKVVVGARPARPVLGITTWRISSVVQIGQRKALPGVVRPGQCGLLEILRRDAYRQSNGPKIQRPRVRILYPPLGFARLGSWSVEPSCRGFNSRRDRRHP